LKSAPARRHPRVQRAAKLVQEIERYLVAAGSRPVHIAEICESFNVHRRKLHRAFNAVTGVPPISHLHHKRLDDVRAALLTAGPACWYVPLRINHPPTDQPTAPDDDDDR
jgi:transcriptional regulator GlxA family with amidase domain